MKTFKQLFANSELVKYGKKELIFSPHLKTEQVYQVVYGYIVTYTLSKDKEKRIQTLLAPGDIFPIVMHVRDIYTNIYCETLTPVTLKKIPKKNFVSLLHKDIRLANEVIGILSNYMAIYVDRLENLELENTEKKVISRLLFFAKRFGKKEKASYNIPVSFSHQFIGDSINVSRENVTRVIARLKKEKLLKSERGALILTNLTALQDKL